MDATVSRITDAGVTIRHRDGLIRLDFHNLTPEQRQSFGMEETTAAAALAAESRQAAALAAWGGQIELAAASAAAEAAAHAAETARLTAARDAALAEARALRSAVVMLHSTPPPFPTGPRRFRPRHIRPTVYRCYYHSPSRPLPFAAARGVVRPPVVRPASVRF